MKRFAAVALGLILALSACAPALAYNYFNDTWLPEYRIVSVVADNQLYMYPRPNSSGEPICAYPIVQSAVHMINEMDDFRSASITKYF